MPSADVGGKNTVMLASGNLLMDCSPHLWGVTTVRINAPGIVWYRKTETREILCSRGAPVFFTLQRDSL